MFSSESTLFSFTIRLLSFTIYDVKILHISSAKTFGGGERHLIDLTRGLKKRGHEIFVALRPTNEWQDKFDFLPPENIFHVSIRNSFGMFSAKRIAKFIRAKNIEIVHAHAARDYLPAGIACRVAKDAELVLTRHVLFPMKPFYRFALNNVSRAIAVSSPVQVNLEKIFPKEKIKVIHNGIETRINDEEARRKLSEDFRFLHNISFDAKIIGIIGELKLLKGQRDFILAAQIVAQKFPEAFFLIVGKDNEKNQKFRRELKRLVSVFRLEDRFLFLDWIEDTAPLFAALDIFVSASHSESFGLAILEAMASKCAIISTETDGAKELLKNDETARLVPVKNPLELANSIEKLLSDEEKCHILAENAQVFAQKQFSLTEMIDKTEDLYKEILKKQKKI